MGLTDDKAAEDVLLFPDRIAEIRPALATLLAQMLENSAYHEGFMLRGIFLTGDTGSPSPVVDLETVDPDAPPPLPAELESTADAAVLSLIVEQPPQPLADTLFRRKIFPESGLAQPAYGEMTRRHRMVRRAKIALAASVALFLIGIAAIPYQTRPALPADQGVAHQCRADRGQNRPAQQGDARKRHGKLPGTSPGARGPARRSKPVRREFARFRSNCSSACRTSISIACRQYSPPPLSSRLSTARFAQRSSPVSTTSFSTRLRTAWRPEPGSMPL